MVTVNWPNLVEAWNYIQSAITSVDKGIHVQLNEVSAGGVAGGTTYTKVGNDNWVGTLIINNVPANLDWIVQNWLQDCWNYLDAKFEAAAKGYTWKDMVMAHDLNTNQPLPPWKSAEYVVKGIDVFKEGNVFQKKQKKYDRYIRKNVPGLAKELEKQNALAELNNILLSIKSVTPNSGYVSQIEDLITWVKMGTIDPETAIARAKALKQQWLGWYKRYTSIIANNSPDSKFETSPSPELNKASDTNGTMDKSPIYYKETSNSTSSDKTINIDLSSLLTSKQSKDKEKKWVYLLIMLAVAIVLVAILIKLKR